METLKTVRDAALEMSNNIENFQNPIGLKTAEYLYDLIIEINAQKVLEIGTSAGYSGLWIAEALLKTGGHLYTIESRPKRHEIATKNFKKAGVSDYVTCILGHAPEDLTTVPNGIDLAFFDATKKETISFLEHTWPKLNSGAKILVDNINSHIDKMQEFIDYLEKNNYKFERINIDAGLVLIHG